MKKLLVGFAALFLFTAQTQATKVIKDDHGGLIEFYKDDYRHVRQSGEDVVIDGFCWSACTFVTIYVPSDRVCVTKRAVLGFHSAWGYDDDKQKVYDPKATEDMWALYPKRVQKLILARGWNGKTEHPDLVKIRGSELYKVCK